MIMGGNSRFNQDNGTLEICFDKSYFQVNTSVLYVYEQFAFMYLGSYTMRVDDLLKITLITHFYTLLEFTSEFTAIK